MIRRGDEDGQKKPLWSLMILAIVLAPGMVGAFQVGPESKRLMECQQRPTIEEPADNQTFVTGVPALLPVGAAVFCQVSDYSKYFFEIQTEYYHQEPGKAPVWKVFHPGSRIPFHPQGDLTVSFRAFKQLEFIYYGQWRLRARAGYLTANGTAIRGPYGIWRYFKINDPSDLPDLVVDGMEVLQVPAGQQTVDGQSYPETMTYVVFTIRNKGTRISPPTRVEIFCHSYIATEVCPQFPKTDIPQLWPKPNELSGAVKIWNSPAAFIRDDSLMGFKITVDPDNLVPESNEENNVRIYTMEQARDQARFKKTVPSALQKKALPPPTASLETGVPVVQGTAGPKKMEAARFSGQALGAPAPGSRPAVSQLAIQSLAVSPLKPRAGAPFEISAQGLNPGEMPLSADYPLFLTCRVIQGGPTCPAPDGPLRLNAVIPGRGNRPFKLGSFKGAPGIYEITLSTQPGMREGSKSLTFTVEAGPPTQKTPAAAAVPAGRPAAPGAPAAGAVSPATQPPAAFHKPVKP
jgi:hypothetical protein